MLLERLNEDIKNSQKTGNSERLRVLRFCLAQIKNREIEKRGAGKGNELSEEEVTEVLQKEAKKRKEATELFRKGGRNDLAENEEKDVAVISEYLPPPVDQAEVVKAIDELVASGNTNFSSLMKEVMQKFKGQVDGKAVSELIKEKLK